MYSDTLEPLFDCKFQVSFNSNSHKSLKMRQPMHLIFVFCDHCRAQGKERRCAEALNASTAQHSKVRQQT